MAADAEIVVGGGNASAQVDFRIIIPEILIFGVGDLGATVTEVTWTTAPTAGPWTTTPDGTGGSAFANPLGGTTPTASFTNGGTCSYAGETCAVSGDTASIPVFLFSNSGRDVEITAATPDFTGTAPNTDTIVTTDITTAEDNSNLINPGLNGTETVAAAAAVINRVDRWTFQYVPSTTTSVTADTYSTSAEYTVSSP